MYPSCKWHKWQRASWKNNEMVRSSGSIMFSYIIALNKTRNLLLQISPSGNKLSLKTSHGKSVCPIMLYIHIARNHIPSNLHTRLSPTCSNILINVSHTWQGQQERRDYVGAWARTLWGNSRVMWWVDSWIVSLRPVKHTYKLNQVIAGQLTLQQP